MKSIPAGSLRGWGGQNRILNEVCFVCRDKDFLLIAELEQPGSSVEMSPLKTNGPAQLILLGLVGWTELLEAITHACNALSP